MFSTLDVLCLQPLPIHEFSLSAWTDSATELTPPPTYIPIQLGTVWTTDLFPMLKWKLPPIASVVFEATHNKFDLIPDTPPFLLAFRGAPCRFLIGRLRTEHSSLCFCPNDSLTTAGQKSQALHCLVLALFRQGCPRLINFAGSRTASLTLLRFRLCSVTLSHVRLSWTPWTIAHQASLSMWLSQYCSGLPFSPPGDLPNAGMEPASLTSPALAGRFFTTEAAGC